MIFEEKELQARRQFHELFGTKYLYTGPRNKALNEDSWNATILGDILHSMHSENPLTYEDIETIIQIGGMVDPKGEMYFHYQADTPMVKEVLTAISPYITKEAFVQCSQKLHGRAKDTVAEFMVKCCTADVPAKRMEATELYSNYTTWCECNMLGAVSRHAFYVRMNALGIIKRKGYVNGRCGVTYYMVQLDEKEVLKDVQSCRKKTEEESQHVEEPLRYVVRPRKAVPPEVVPEATESLPQLIEEADVATVDTGSDEQVADDVKEDGAVNERIEQNPSDDSVSDVPDTIDDAPDSPEPVEVVGVSPDQADSPATDNKAGTGSPLTVKKLPMHVRQCFRLMKITYRVAPEHFTQEEFQDTYAAASLPPIEGASIEDLYQLFLDYANIR